MVSVTAIVVWNVHPIFVLLAFLVFASLDGLFLSSALAKVPQGAWLTLMLTAVLCIFVLVWRYGKEQQWKAESQGRKSLSELVVAGPKSRYYIKHKRDNEEVELELVNIKGQSSILLVSSCKGLQPLTILKALHCFSTKWESCHPRSTHALFASSKFYMSLRSLSICSRRCALM